MQYFYPFLTILGLAIYETVSSIDNAIINAEVLSTMGQKAKKWFLVWGMLFSVFLIRGFLPWGIIWITNPSLGPAGALTATFSSDPRVKNALEESSPVLLIGGGVFLVFLFFNWLFTEPKNYLIKGERFFNRYSLWFYATVSLILSLIVWFAIKINPLMAFGAVVGSSAFFITHGFRENAQVQEADLKSNVVSDLSKILFLEIIDASFSIDGVLGAFAFTLSVPLILLGSGLGAVVVRQLTVSNIKRVGEYIYLENGAMYSVFVLGLVMVFNSFKFGIPEWFSPVSTLVIVGYFFWQSKKARSKIISV